MVEEIIYEAIMKIKKISCILSSLFFITTSNAGDTCLQQNFWDIWFNQGSFKGFGAPPSETQIQKAQVELAENYYLGDRIAKNYKSAYDLFLRASKGDLTQANFRLGLMNHYGQGKEKDLIKAFDHYQLAANQNDNEAQFNLALMYRYGLGWASAATARPN